MPMLIERHRHYALNDEDDVAQLEHDYHVALNWVPFRIREPEFGLW